MLPAFLITVGIFSLIALASSQIGKAITRFQFPLITGYLITGIFAGHFVFDVITTEAVLRLHWLEEISLAAIAFAAGSELYLKEIRSQLRSIGWNTVAQVVFPLSVFVPIAYFLMPLIPFAEGLGNMERVGVSLLIATILIARSPSSAIAIIEELRAKGPFSKTVLGITVITDVLIIILFALNVQITDEIFTQMGFSLTFILVLVIALGGSFVVGYIFSKTVEAVIQLQMEKWLKIVLILLFGLGVFEGSAWLREYTHANLAFEIVLEPLLICMVASFTVTNYSPVRDTFAELVHDVSPLIYIAFFTLTGAAIQLDIFFQTWPLALALFAIRFIVLFLAGLVGGTLARDAFTHRMFYGFAFITQAGVGIGLAQEAGLEFPALGTAFATLMISVIVVSQLFGPPLMKLAIRSVGEARTAGVSVPDQIRDAVIIGIEGQSIALCRQLRTHGWQVTLVDTDRDRVDQLEHADVTERHVTAIDAKNLADIVNEKTDAMVAMLDDDDANFRACELAYRQGVARIIVNLNDMARREAFQKLGVIVLNPTSAMVNLLEHFVRAPEAFTHILDDEHEEANDIVQITVTDQDVTGLPLRDMRLPLDVLILEITRRGEAIVPQGYTELQMYDEVTIMGTPESLSQVTRRFGF